MREWTEMVLLWWKGAAMVKIQGPSSPSDSILYSIHTPFSLLGGGGGGEVKVASAQAVATFYLDVGPIKVGEWHASYCCVLPVLVVMCIYTCILLHGI